MFAAGDQLDEVLRAEGYGATNPVGMFVAMVTNDQENPEIGVEGG